MVSKHVSRVEKSTGTEESVHEEKIEIQITETEEKPATAIKGPLITIQGD
jgi:hypothetical protein